MPTISNVPALPAATAEAEARRASAASEREGDMTGGRVGGSRRKGSQREREEGKEGKNTRAEKEKEKVECCGR